MIAIHHADCLAHMPTMEPNSVDAVVTDPPYGIGFMEKGWDRTVPGPHYWAEVLRVAKPGAHLLAFGGTRTFHRLACAIEDAGWDMRDTLMWVYAQGMPKTADVSKDMPDGPRQQWAGWASQLKPAWEPIIMARKPLEGTLTANVMKYGTGALNIDASRVPMNGEVVRTMQGGALGVAMRKGYRMRYTPYQSDPNGRWPSNVVHDGSDEVVQHFPDAPGQQGDVPDGLKRTGGIAEGRFSDSKAFSARGDEGSAARFFYCAKASAAERGKGNNHPTVKPVRLMRWLCRMVTPVGGTIFDPFTGSGSTAKAAGLDGFNFIGCEKEAEHVATARSRCTIETLAL